MDNSTTQEMGEYIFKVLPFEVDFRSKLKLPNLVNYILNCAGYHADFCHYGLSDLQKHDYSWVLIRVAIEMDRYPKMYEKVHVQTWVEGFIKIFSKRNYAFLDADGKILGYARTIWAVIDNKTRKAVNISEILDKQAILEKDCPIDRIRNIPAISESDVAKEQFTVKYSDIDMNQHLNSSKYVEHILDAFTLHKFVHRDIERFEIDYMAESLFNETISLHKEEMPDNKFIIELRNKDGNVICKSRVIFSQKNQNDEYRAGCNDAQTTK